MASTVSVVVLTEEISKFEDLRAYGMEKTMNKHFHEYLLDIMITPEIRRKIM